MIGITNIFHMIEEEDIPDNEEFAFKTNIEFMKNAFKCYTDSLDAYYIITKCYDNREPIGVSSIK